MEQKKETRAQLERRVKQALVFVPKDKDYNSIFFTDKGVRLEVTQDSAVISTYYHRHVFSNITSQGLSRPWLYTKRVIEIALANLNVESDYSYQHLLDTLKAKEDQSEYNICVYYDWFLFNIFQPLYGIAEDTLSSFLVYEDYIHNIARNTILLAEKTEDITNKGFIDKVVEQIKSFTENLTEDVIIKKKSDDEMLQEEISAIQEQEQEQAMEAQINESKD
jgi:hypothetical protein